MREHNNDTLFVSDAGRTGIVTGMNLGKAAILGRLPLETPVRDICHFDIAAVDPRRLPVRRADRHDAPQEAAYRHPHGSSYSGVLEDIDILELFAGNSQLIPGRIDRAKTVAELTRPAQRYSGAGAAPERAGRQGRGHRRDNLGP